MFFLGIELQLDDMSLGDFGPAINDNFSCLAFEVGDGDVDFALPLGFFL